MVVPSPYGLAGDAFVRSLIDAGYLGTLREVHVHGLSSELADPATPLGWRQMTQVLGLQHADAGDPLRDGPALDAAGQPGLRLRLEAYPQADRSRDGQAVVKVGTPDSVQVLTTHEGGASRQLSAQRSVWHENRMGIAMYGSEGTLIYELTRDEIDRRPPQGSRTPGAADPREASRRLAGRGRLRRGDPRRAPGHPHRLRHRRPLHAVHRGRRPQLAAPASGHPAASGILEPGFLCRRRMETHRAGESIGQSSGIDPARASRPSAHVARARLRRSPRAFDQGDAR